MSASVRDHNRRLRPGEKVPPNEPRRYITRDGYRVLRWKIGRREYVEQLEHRIRNGVVVDAQHVHHRNGDKLDNRPENLEFISARDHQSHHHPRSTDRAEVVRLYLSGLSTPMVAERLGTFPGNVSRILAESGIAARSTHVLSPDEERAAADALRSGVRASTVCESFQISRSTLGRIQRDHGVRLPVGRPKRSIAA